MFKRLTLVLFLTACSGGFAPALHGPVTPQDQTRALPAQQTSFVYVTSSFGTSVSQYKAADKNNSGPVCQVGSIARPGAVATAGTTTLYVATFVTGNQIDTFRADCGKRNPETYLDTIGSPADIAVDGSTLYVSNAKDNNDKLGNIAVYTIESRGGKFKPARQLTSSDGLQGSGIAVDSAHDVFWSVAGREFAYGRVIEFPGGKSPSKTLSGPNIGTDLPGSVLVDTQNNLLFVDGTTGEVLVYAPPYTSGPVQTIALKGQSLHCGFGPAKSQLYCLDYQNSSVDVYGYPSGKWLYTFSNGIQKEAEPVGIAVN